MRISKDGDIRKQELLDAALQLFYEKGYEKTSVNDIIEKIGVSKGAFYYYFKSKEEVLDNLSMQQTEKIIKIIKKIAENNRLNTLEKLNKVIAESLEYKIAHQEHRIKIHKVFEQGVNSKLQRRILENNVEFIRPTIQSIVEQGIQEGVFDTVFPEEAAEVYIYCGSILRNMLSKLLREKGGEPGNIEIIKQKLIFYEDLIERILGAKKGSIKISQTLLKYFLKPKNIK